MEKNEEAMESPSMMTYVIGAVLVIAVVAGAWYFRGKNQQAGVTEPTTQTQQAAIPTPGPITGLACDVQYYNQKVGFAEYYLSAEGGDLSPAKTVTCDFTAKDGEKVLSKTSVESPLSDAPQRGGKTFRCTTKSVEITPNVETTIDVVLKDDAKRSATCSATFTFPAP